MAKRERTHQINLYLNDYEYDLLKQRCKMNKENASQIIRELIVFGFNYCVDNSNLFSVCNEIRFIRSKGINPDKITYEQVAEGIEKLNKRASDRKQWHRQLSAELKGMEKQMSLIADYLNQSTRDRSSICHKQKDSWEL